MKKPNCIKQLIKGMKSCGVDITLENLLVLLDAHAKPDDVLSHIRLFLPLVKSRGNTKLAAKPECGEVAKDIRNHVFHKCFINQKENIENAVIFYDKIFRGLKTYFSLKSIHQSDPDYPYPDVPIFTTNFDNSVELFCRRQKVHITDGYSKSPMGGYKFDENEYNQSTNPNFLRLYKMHGTVRYVKNPFGNFDEVTYLYPGKPIVINETECFPELIFSESYQYILNSPQLELLYAMKKEFLTSDIIVIIGYSFPDPHILNVFREALRENGGAYVILFSRNPNSIIEKKLCFMKDRCIGIPKDAKSIDLVNDLLKKGVPH